MDITGPQATHAEHARFGPGTHLMLNTENALRGRGIGAAAASRPWRIAPEGVACCGSQA